MQILSLTSQAFLTTAGLTRASPPCRISAARCQNYPSLDDATFLDSIGHGNGITADSSGCLRRAEDFHHWCGNDRHSSKQERQNKGQRPPDVAATHLPSGDTQFYRSGACDSGWSLYHKSCYVHVWRAKTWWEAEQWCNERNGNLCSIHGKHENEFVFTLTKGISSWIGFHDVDQDQEYKWTDSSKSDYENRAKNCTGRESEPDCQPKEQAQQWYDWQGHDRGSWVCKKKAKFNGVKVLRNVTDVLAIWRQGVEQGWDGVFPEEDAERERLINAKTEFEKEKEELEEDMDGMVVRQKKVFDGREDVGKEKCTTC